ncbi:hypothetical protein PIB30_097392, partial [Stylosanthes scabra]|nr:hypothetical protein [Stylosanthes scabra]
MGRTLQGQGISLYRTIELEPESGGISLYHRVKLYHEQNNGKKTEVYLLEDASDHQGTIDDHL